MVKLLALALSLLLACSAQAQRPIFGPVARPHSGILGLGTSLLIQHPKNSACTTAACSVTVASTTAGNLLELWSATKYAGTGVATVTALTSVTDNGTSETWTHCPQSQINDGQNSNGEIHGLDCYYVLSAAGGATSVTATWTLTGLTGPTVHTDVVLLEYQPPSAMVYDTGNAFFQSANCTTCTGPAGLDSGTSDVVTQAIYNPTGASSISSISGSYSNPFDTDNASNALFAGFAGALNLASYSQPTWTLASSSLNPSFYSMASFGTTASPAPTGNVLIDFSACTNGAQPTTTCVGSSTFSGWAIRQGGMSGANTGMSVATSIISSNLPATTTINGVAKSGGSTLDLKCVTDATGSACANYEMDLGVSNSESMYNPLTVGFTFRSTCAATGDCGALGVRLANSAVAGFYAVAHPSPLGDGKFCLETSSSAGCGTGNSEGGSGGSPASYAASTNYRINIQMAGVSGTVDKMTVCADGAGGAVLGTMSSTSAATANGISALQIGIVGEEPTTVGYVYYFRNIVVGGVYSTTSCF